MSLPKLKWWVWLFIIVVLGVFAGMMDKKNNPSSVSTPQRVQHWYEGGTLHKATITQWKVATDRDKLATAADWLAATLWKEYLKSPKDFERMKVKAQMLVREIDKSIAVKNIDHLEITEITTALLLMSKDFGPDK